MILGFMFLLLHIQFIFGLIMPFESNLYDISESYFSGVHMGILYFLEGSMVPWKPGGL